MHNKFTFIDLFAGIGGLRLPFEDLGGTCVLTSEIDPYAKETYCANFTEDSAHRFVGDVRQVSEHDVPDHDVLLAGFPCQPFSHAGLRKGFDDTRGTLFFDVARIIEAKKPKVVVLENVRGLRSHDNGNTLERILQILDAEYFTSVSDLNAKHFGLPQSRARIFIVGIRRDIQDASSFKGLSKPLAPVPTTVGSILEGTVPEKYTISDRLWASHQARKAKHLENGNGWGYKLVQPESTHTGTISARYYKDGAEILIDQPGLNPRKLTPREAARLQGFPDEFKLPCSDSQTYKQIGNSVPVTVVRALADTLAKFLF
jgi:DNA (cytosine-5)-methyltransferase 1